MELNIRRRGASVEIAHLDGGEGVGGVILEELGFQERFVSPFLVVILAL